MSDWLEDRRRVREAQRLRSGRWKLVLVQEGGWQPQAKIYDLEDFQRPGAVYLSSDWLPAEATTTDSPDRAASQ
jgi:hypothetical protein